MRVHLVPLRAALLGCAALFVWGVRPAWSQPAAKYAGSEACKECHEDAWSRFQLNVHALAEKDPKLVGDVVGCEACHGPGSAHIEAVSSAGAERARALALQLERALAAASTLVGAAPARLPPVRAIELTPSAGYSYLRPLSGAAAFLHVAPDGATLAVRTIESAPANEDAESHIELVTQDGGRERISDSADVLIVGWME